MTVKARSISCPNCGGPVQLRGFAHTLTVTCPQCQSVLDASTPEVAILQKFQNKSRIQPKIPLGSRGKLGDTEYEVIGFQVRQVAGDAAYFWEEYLLFNPFQGFRYLTEYDGHWNFVRVLSSLPEETRGRGRIAMRMGGQTYLAFDSMTAQTIWVMGEFPWQVRVGDSAGCQDFIAPPYMLSSESTGGETTWSRGEYLPGAQIWSAFRLPGGPPVPRGVFANQLSPYGKVGSTWRTWLWLNVALAALVFFFLIASPGHVAFSDSYVFVPGVKSDAAFVTPSFQLTGRDSNVELGIKTNLDNNWAYFSFALINEQTGQAFDFAREVSYYHDSDGTEGSRNNSVIIPSVPSGQYYLRVEPETDDKSPSSFRYELEVRRNVANFTFFGIAALLLLVPPIIATVRRAGFETARWRESDYAPQSSGGDD